MKIVTMVNSSGSLDGTPAGTERFYTFPGVTGGVDPRHKMEVNGQLVFYAEGNDLGQELWTTDGTQAGTKMVLDINTTPNMGSFDTNPIPMKTDSTGSEMSCLTSK